MTIKVEANDPFNIVMSYLSSWTNACHHQIDTLNSSNTVQEQSSDNTVTEKTSTLSKKFSTTFMTDESSIDLLHQHLDRFHALQKHN